MNRIRIKDEINPLLNIVYNGGERLVKDKNIELKLFKHEDKYIIQNYTLNKSLELSSDEFKRDLNMFYPRETSLSISGLSVTSFMAGEFGLQAPLIILIDKRNNIKYVLDLRNFKYSTVESLNKRIRHIKYGWLNDVIYPFIVLMSLVILTCILT